MILDGGLLFWGPPCIHGAIKQSRKAAPSHQRNKYVFIWSSYVRCVWLQLQLLSLVVFAEYCWFYSFLSFEFCTAEMLVFLCLRISASSIWNFSRFGVFYWYFVQFSAWSSVNRIAVYHATLFLPSITNAVVQHWTGKPVTSSAAYNCVGVAVVLGNTVDAKRLQPVQWRHQPAVLQKSPQYSVTGALSITITTSISCFPGDGMSVPQYWKLFNAVR